MTLLFNFLEIGILATVFFIGIYMIIKFKKAGLATPPVLSGICFILIASTFALNNYGLF